MNIFPNIASSSVKILELSEFTCRESKRLSLPFSYFESLSSSSPLCGSDGSNLAFSWSPARGVPSIVNRKVPPQYIAGRDGNQGDTISDVPPTDVVVAPVPAFPRVVEGYPTVPVKGEP